MVTHIFTVKGEPHGKGRPRFSSRGGHVHTYTPDTTAVYEQEIGLRYKAKYPKLHGDITIRVFAYYGIPKKTSRKDRALMLDGFINPEKKTDIDNVIKSVLDGLNGIAYDDDKQVTDVRGVKMYSEEPRIEVMVGGQSD